MNTVEFVRDPHRKYPPGQEAKLKEKWEAEKKALREKFYQIMGKDGNIRLGS